MISPRPTKQESKSALAGVLTIIVFVNSALLFVIEPMFSKSVLPLLGGTPSVWNTCLVFFQGALLVGYLYAHILTRIGTPRTQAIVHIALFAISFLALPVAVRAGGDPPIGGAAIAWLLAVLVASVGAPFVMLASGAPLAQRWLSNSGHPESANPYFLYAASNFGSLIALLSYPLVVEPNMALSTQRLAWSVAYAALATVVATTLALDATTKSHSNPAWPASNRPSVGILARGPWIVYSAVPAALLVAVTSYISTDVAAVPLLWIIPLALYLLSFVIVFSNRPILARGWMIRVAPHTLVIIAIPIFWRVRLPGLFGILVPLVVLFVVAMVCHGELASRRPAVSDLTEFFVWVGIGGFLGGLFCAIIAPLIFSRVYEYPIILAIAGLLLPAESRARQLRIVDFLIPVGIAGALWVSTRNIRGLPSPSATMMSILLGVIVFSLRASPVRFGLALGAIFIVGQLRDSGEEQHRTVLDSERTYFGVYRIVKDSGEKMITFYHGRTLHGAQSFEPSRRLVPLTYYHPNGPAGDVFADTPAGMKADRNVGIVGLGAGSLACYGRSGEYWEYYEIDPAVARIALDKRYFTFLRDCAPSIRIVFGDARLTLRRARKASYDILILDAFSSDAIPIHLLTIEAFRDYLRLLAPHGLIAVHISNDHLDLEPVVAAVARELDVEARIRRDFFFADSDAVHGRSQSVWALVGRSSSDFGALDNAAQWQPPSTRRKVVAWTDDFSNIVKVFALR